MPHSSEPPQPVLIVPQLAFCSLQVDGVHDGAVQVLVTGSQMSPLSQGDTVEQDVPSPPLAVHAPLIQVWIEEHSLPHSPQLVWLFDRSTHCPSHCVKSMEHAGKGDAGPSNGVWTGVAMPINSPTLLPLKLATNTLPEASTAIAAGLSNMPAGA